MTRGDARLPRLDDFNAFGSRSSCSVFAWTCFRRTASRLRRVRSRPRRRGRSTAAARSARGSRTCRRCTSCRRGRRRARALSRRGRCGSTPCRRATTCSQWIGRRCGQVADEHLRRGIELVGDDVEVAVAVEVEDDRRAAAERRHHGDLPGSARGRDRVPSPSVQTVEVEPGRVRPAAAARLDAEQELAVEKLLAAVVQQQRVDAVAVREVHAGGDEDVLPAVGVEVADARAPGPVVLDADAVGDLLELCRRRGCGRARCRR